MLEKFVRVISVAMVLATTMGLQGCLESEEERQKADKAAVSKSKAAERIAYQRALRKRQCDFIGRVINDKGQCVDKP